LGSIDDPLTYTMLDLATYTPIQHGGNLGDAVRRYCIARQDWLDLSTGINPYGYPVPPIDPQTWLRLPDDDDGLETIAAGHYHAPWGLAVAGTQAAIRMLPGVLPAGPIGIGLLTYGEYAPAFVRAGFHVERFVTEPIADRLGDADFTLRPGQPLPGHLKHLVVVNPNNPSADLFEPDVLLDWHRQLASRGGTLIVDEAFIDATPAFSVASSTHLDGLVVLRSIGKFFGLAGARAGFVLAASGCDAAMRRMRGPWTISGPARVVVRAALLDEAWQRQTQARVMRASARLAELLTKNGLAVRRTALFAWACDVDAERWQDRLARHGVWVRRFDIVPSLRFGLPIDEPAWGRLEAALSDARRHVVA
jgi:cobalamin biosynthetic protein CobC